MADDTNTAEREAIIRAAVAAMPHIDPLVADDLLDGFTMRTEADDIVAIFQAGRASLAASAAPLSCGHPASMMLMSAETGDPLYCELCDSNDRRRDAETRWAELQQQLVDMKSINAQLIDALKTVRSQESDLWAPWLTKQVDEALAKRPIAEHASASLAASAGGEPWGAFCGGHVWVGKLPAHVPKMGLPIQWLYTHPSPPEGMAGWKPIETAPKDCLVDILNAGRRYAGCHYDRICDEYRHITACGVLIRLKNATHWMPAPRLPAS